MAKYCRYCGEVMKQPKDRFCYSCRRSGDGVDRFYKKISEEDKFPLNEIEQDVLRYDGLETIIGNGLVMLFPLPFLCVDISFILGGYGKFIPYSVRIFFIVMVVILAYVMFLGLRLFMLKKNAFKLKFNVWIYKTFKSLFYFRRGSYYIVFKVGASQKKLQRAEFLEYLMNKFANEEDDEAQYEYEKLPPKEDKSIWICGFCGYKNKYSDYSCKSCGKERIKERR